MLDARAVLERLARGEAVGSEEAARALETLPMKRRRGGCPATRQARIRARDAALREAAATLEPSGKPTDRARALQARASRYEIRWPRDRDAGGPPEDPIDRIFFEMKRDGVRVPGLRHLQSVLRDEIQ